MNQPDYPRINGELDWNAIKLGCEERRISLLQLIDRQAVIFAEAGPLAVASARDKLHMLVAEYTYNSLLETEANTLLCHPKLKERFLCHPKLKERFEEEMKREPEKPIVRIPNASGVVGIGTIVTRTNEEWYQHVKSISENPFQAIGTQVREFDKSAKK